MKLFSPAKLNLFFRVLDQRDDGFHEIATLMQAVSLGDILSFKISDSNQIFSSNPILPVDDRNSVFQALALFRKKTGYQTPITIHIEKKIPIEGGFGGGSSNSATTLWALNKISRKQIDEKILSEWAGELSSDAPFFFSSGTAYATGRGETIQSLPPLQRGTLFLAKPKKGLSTPFVYQNHRLTLSSKSPHFLLQQALSGSIRGWNDLEKTAFFLDPTLKELKKNLLALGFNMVSMTGSGSGFYCLGEVTNPSLPEVDFWKVHFLFRKREWYPSPFCES